MIVAISYSQVYRINVADLITHYLNWFVHEGFSESEVNRLIPDMQVVNYIGL